MAVKYDIKLQTTNYKYQINSFFKLLVFIIMPQGVETVILIHQYKYQIPLLR